MTEHELEFILALAGVSYPPATAAKRFARDMASIARNNSAYELSDRQKHYAKMIAWRYRRQMPTRFVPDSDPGSLPPPERKRKQKTVMPSPHPELFAEAA